MKTPSVKLSLRKTRIANESIVYFDIFFQNQRKRISTGIKLKNGILRNNRVAGGSRDQIGDNLQLAEYFIKIDNAIRESRSRDGEYSWDKFENSINTTFNIVNDNTKDEYGVLLKFRQFIKYKQNNEKLKRGTIQTYITTLIHLEEFQSILSTTFTFENFTKKKIEMFVNYLSSKGVSNNTISKYVKNIKAFYRWLYNNKIVDDIRMVSSISVKKRKVKYPTLNSSEIQKLWDVKLKTKNQKKYRDLFLILCYSGLRVSELSQINAYTTNADLSILTYHNSKTDETHTKYFAEKIRKLIKLYFIDNNTNINHQKFNKIIKAVCKKAGINQKFPIEKYVKNKLETIFKNKYELITTHTGRRTFCTLIAGDKNISISDAIELSGHKSIQMFERYVNNNTVDVIKKHSDSIDDLFE